MWTFNPIELVLESGRPIVANTPSKFVSPLIGGTTNPYAAAIPVEDDEKGYNVVALAKIDGLIFGMFQMSSGPVPYPYSLGGSNHAEDGFISAFEAFRKTALYEAMLAVHDSMHNKFSVTLKQTKTPCETCADKLIAFATNYDLRLRIKAMVQYKGAVKSAQMATQKLVQSQIPVLPFNIPRRITARKGRNNNGYTENRWGQEHELKYVSFDEKERVDDHSSQQFAKAAKAMLDYRAAFDFKERELGTVVLAAIFAGRTAPSSADEIAAKLLENYKESAGRVTRQNFEDYKTKLRKAVAVAIRVRKEVETFKGSGESPLNW